MKSQTRKENNLILHNAAISKAATLTKILKDSNTFCVKFAVGKNVIDDKGRTIKDANAACEIQSIISDESKHEEHINIIPSENFIMDMLTVLYKHKLLSDAYNVEIAALNVANAQKLREHRDATDKHVTLMKDTLNVGVQAAYDESNKKADVLIAEHRKAIEAKNKQYKKL